MIFLVIVTMSDNFDTLGSSNRELCLVIPCFNESARLVPEHFDELLATGWISLVVVNDGSSDDTGKILDSLARDRSRVTVLHLDTNCGKGEAVRQGCLAALRTKTKLIGYIDADFATPVSEVIRLAQIALTENGKLVVMGSRVKTLGSDINRSTIRHFIGRLFATLISLAIQESVYDSQCGLKLFRQFDELQNVFATPFLSRWLFDVEILLRLKTICGLRERNQLDQIALEVPLYSWSEVQGSKTRVSDGIIALLQITRISYSYRESGLRFLRKNNRS